jgi:hypothetical protein
MYLLAMSLIGIVSSIPLGDSVAKPLNWQTITPGLNCNNSGALRRSAEKPFSHGHARGAFFARYHHQDVVVKKPIGEYTTVCVL